MDTYIRWALVLLCCGVILAVLWPSEAGSPAESEALAQGRVIITFWDRHSGHEHDSRVALIDEFNRVQDEVYVRALPIGYNALMEKLLTSTAGGAPPDVCAMDGSILAQLAAQGCFLPLDDFMAGHRRLRKEAFYPHVWEMVWQDDQVYGVPVTHDTYCLLWNRDAFRKAGLDPDQPPRTIEELQAYAAKLTIQDGSGIRQIGFLPWLPWDHTYQIGVLFGGTWFDRDADRMVCADDPKILESLRWQQSFAIDPNAAVQPPHALDPEKIMTFSKNFGEYFSATNPFCSGKVAMIFEGEWQCTFIPKYAPDLDWGVAPIPVPEGAEPATWSPTCIADCVPTGCRHPEAAFKFLEWFHTPRADGRPSPSSDYNYAIHNLPVRPDEAAQDRFVDDPKFGEFVDVITERKTVTGPVMPETQFMYDVIELQRERVTLRKATPREALDAIQRTVNVQLTETRSFIKRSRQ